MAIHDYIVKTQSTTTDELNRKRAGLIETRTKTESLVRTTDPETYALAILTINNKIAVIDDELRCRNEV